MGDELIYPRLHTGRSGVKFLDCLKVGERPESVQIKNLCGDQELVETCMLINGIHQVILCGF